MPEWLVEAGNTDACGYQVSSLLTFGDEPHVGIAGVTLHKTVTRLRAFPPLWCCGALYSTHIVAPRTQNFYAVMRDKLRMPHGDQSFPIPHRLQACSPVGCGDVWGEGGIDRA